MPRNLSAWVDLLIHLTIMLVLVIVVWQYNKFIATIAFILWVVLAFFARERTVERQKNFTQYCENVIASFDELMHYAMKSLPYAVIVVNDEGRLEWCNELTKSYTDKVPEQGMYVNEVWEGLLDEKILEVPESGNFEDGKDGDYKIKSVRTIVNKDNVPEEVERHFVVRYRRMKIRSKYPRLIVLFIHEITLYENLKIEYENSRTVLMYMQIDNYDEITQGLTETEKSSMMLSVNAILETWVKSLSGFIRKVSEDLFVVVLERSMLKKAIAEKFDVLDKIRQLVNKNQMPVTLSMGVAFAEKPSPEQSMTELGEQARSELDLALGRGGDQVAVKIGDKTQFFGGRTNAVEKHTRVKSRVVANAIRESMEAADEIFVMGHAREDFDAFGAAIGVAVMAKKLGKQVHVVLSDYRDSIEKITDFFEKDKNDYEELLIGADDLPASTALNPLLFVVDTHIPQMTAAPKLLERIPQVIVIDHHRRSENFIKNPLMVYLEPAASSTCELVTELLMYFEEKISIGKLAATALYSGIVVDTKNFAIQTGSRTFDAAAYLRRSGADPVIVRHLFKDDYETTVALAKTKAQSEYYEGGLIVSTIPNIIPNVQVVAGQAADSLLSVENVRMTIILFQMPNDTVGVSARSSGELNVQIIMEKFGGGGHQNVAGAQIKNTNIIELKKMLVEAARTHIAEIDSAKLAAKAKTGVRKNFCK